MNLNISKSPELPGLCPWQWLLGVAVLIVLLQIIEHQVGWQAVVSPWQNMSFAQGAAIFGLMLASHLLRALRIHYLLSHTTPSRLWPMFKLSAVHQFFNNLLPMRLGEAAFPILMKRYYGTSLAQAVSQLIWLRILDLIFMGSVVVIVLALLAPTLWLLIPPGLALVAAAGLWIYQHRKHRQALPPLLGKIRWLGRALEHILAQAPPSFRAQSVLIGITAASWLCKITAACAIITALSPLPVVAALTAAIAVELSGILPIHGVAGSGSFEAAFFAGASLAEGMNAEWLAVAFNAHVFLFGCTALVALIALPISVNKTEVISNHER